jgi:hypothetical protein
VSCGWLSRLSWVLLACMYVCVRACVCARVCACLGMEPAHSLKPSVFVFVVVATASAHLERFQLETADVAMNKLLFRREKGDSAKAVQDLDGGLLDETMFRIPGKRSYENVWAPAEVLPHALSFLLSLSLSLSLTHTHSLTHSFIRSLSRT